MGATMAAAPRTLRFDVSGLVLTGDLTIPDAPRGLVLFANGNGSSRTSPDDQRVADRLQQHEVATLLLDLFTRDELAVEAVNQRLRSDVPLLAKRLIAATDSVSSRSPTWRLPVAYFAEGSGAAAAIIAAAARPSRVWAVVSHSGRPDLAADALDLVAAPTLLIMDKGDDQELQRANEGAFRSLQGPRDLIHSDAGSMRGGSTAAIDEVARLTVDWLARHRSAAAPRFETASALR